MPNDTIVDIDQLMMGVEEEGEHTDDLKTKLTIALQHLSEDPEYYTKLKDAMTSKEVKKSMANCKPRSGENRSDFVGRCVKKAVKDGKTQEEAVGMCESIFTEAKKQYSRGLIFKALAVVTLKLGLALRKRLYP